MKKLITAAFAALLLVGVAVAGPVVVTPGSVAGYMYIEGGGSASSVLPVVTENAACTATTSDNTGINSTYTKVMTCNGGAWKPISVGALQTVTSGGACTASTTNNIGVDSGFTKVYMCAGGTWQEYSPTAKSVQTATLGAACVASATNNIAVTPDFESILSCQSGVWAKQVATGAESTSGARGTFCPGGTYCNRSGGGGICYMSGYAYPITYPMTWGGNGDANYGNPAGYSCNMGIFWAS